MGANVVFDLYQQLAFRPCVHCTVKLHRAWQKQEIASIVLVCLHMLMPPGEGKPPTLDEDCLQYISVFYIPRSFPGGEIPLVIRRQDNLNVVLSNLPAVD